MTINDVYQQIKNAVLFYPKSAQKCKCPQAFRVLFNESHIAASNLGATVRDKHTPFFYSRAWADIKHNPNNIIFDYPLVVATPLTSDVTFKHGATSSLVRLQIGVLDKYVNDCDTCAPESCGARTSEQVRQDTEQMLINVLQYLSSVNLYKIKDVQHLYTPGQVAELQRTGVVKEVDLLRRGVLFDSLNVNIEPIEPLSDIFGSAVTVNVKVSDCADIEFDYSVNEPIETVYAAGCDNCGN